MLRPLRTIRNIPRLTDIGFVLVKHGLHHIAGAIGAPIRVRLRGWLPLLGKSRPSQAAQLRHAFQELGPIFIKLGQLIANRPDLFSPAMVEEFSHLEDRVPPVPFDRIREQIEQELGGPLGRFYRHVEEQHLAAASLAQVHRAITLAGDEVILKVQKPGVQRIVESDLEILELFAEALARFTDIGSFDPAGLVGEVRRSLERELNFSFERNALDRVRAHFEDDPTFVVPRTYPELCTERVLTLQYLSGRPLRHCDPAELGRQETRRIARECSRVLFEMIFRDGYFHGDPHSSNILLLDDGRIGWIDFGSMGLLTSEMQHRLVRLLRVLLERDYLQVAREVLLLGRPRSDIHVFEFSQDLASRIDPYFGLTLGETDLPALFDTVLQLAREYEISLPPGFVVMTRCLVLMEGLAYRLAPDFDTVAEMEPLLRQHLLERYRPDRLAGEVVDQFLEAGRALREYPRLIGDVLQRAADGRLRIDTELRGLDSVRRGIEGSSNKVVLALVVSSLLVSSSMILNLQVGPELGGFPVIGLIGYLFAALIGIRIVFSMIR